MTYFGILNIDKPKGLTSHDVVARIRKILKIKQVGHTGTLDPIATGVLPICIGKATKTIQYLDGAKAYRAFVKLGIRTDSYDMDGKVLEENNVELDLETIKLYLKDFFGVIKQKPPIFSAVHYKGKRLYEYARQNIEVPDIPEREVEVSYIELVEVLEKESKNPVLVVDISCSGGTYIRSIINDLGNKLGYGACMQGLIRTKAGAFKIAESYTIDQIDDFVQNNSLDKILINPVEKINLKKVEIKEFQIEKIRHGQPIQIENLEFIENEKVVLFFNKNLCAIAEFKDNKISPTNVFV